MNAAVLRDASPVDAARVASDLESQRDASSGSERRVCAWCEGTIPPRARRDALCCSTRCRQARHRFVTAVGRGAVAFSSSSPLRLAYADPPYPGMAARYYRDHPDFGGEVDHQALIRRLSTYDGWALSTSAAALPAVLASCPPGVRVAAWFRGERPTRSAWPLNAWEPVIYFGGRPYPSRPPAETTDPSCPDPDPSARTGATRRLDALIHFARPRTTDPRRVIGAKPAAFARWMFDLLGAQPDDTLDDLFPGSRGIERAWAVFTARELAGAG